MSLDGGAANAPPLPEAYKVWTDLRGNDAASFRIAELLIERDDVRFGVRDWCGRLQVPFLDIVCVVYSDEDLEDGM